jgi:hypothetical protein
LAKKYGADIQLCDLIDRIALDCPWKSKPGERPPDQYDPKCKAPFTDLDATSRPPPDLPPTMRRLAVIQGGKG